MVTVGQIKMKDVSSGTKTAVLSRKIAQLVFSLNNFNYKYWINGFSFQTMGECYINCSQSIDNFVGRVESNASEIFVNIIEIKFFDLKKLQRLVASLQMIKSQ